MEWSSSGTWLISADNSGTIKYFQTNMNNLQAFQGHAESIRDVTFAPNDARFATGSDDGTIKIWNFEEMREEKTLTGHGWDVKCVKWHPTKGLLVSGSKDNLIKFWDPRTSKVLTTLFVHRSVLCAKTDIHATGTVTRIQCKLARGVRRGISSRPLRGINSSKYSTSER